MAQDDTDTPSEQTSPDDAASDPSAGDTEDDSSTDDSATDEASPDEAAEESEAASGPWDIAKPCANVQHPYQADVCQQWRAAQASESSARLSRMLMWIGLISLLLLLIMLWAVFRAVAAARRASESGPAPVRLSSSSNGNDREAELRAYVDLDSLEFVDTPEGDGVVKVKITLRNSGQTPALKLETVAEMAVLDISDEADLPVRALPDDSNLGPSRPRLGRDANAVVIVQCESSPKLAERVTSGDATIVVWGASGYYDIFDKRRRTAFQYFCNAETLETGEMFRPMVRGDEAG